MPPVICCTIRPLSYTYWPSAWAAMKLKKVALSTLMCELMFTRLSMLQLASLSSHDSQAVAPSPIAGRERRGCYLGSLATAARHTSGSPSGWAPAQARNSATVMRGFDWAVMQDKLAQWRGAGTPGDGTDGKSGLRSAYSAGLCPCTPTAPRWRRRCTSHPAKSTIRAPTTAAVWCTQPAGLMPIGASGSGTTHAGFHAWN